MQTITIHLHTPDKETIDIEVRPDDSVGVLKNYVNGIGSQMILFKNNLIMTAFSFSFFDIHDGDHLFVVQYTKAQRCTSAKKTHTRSRLETRRTALFNSAHAEAGKDESTRRRTSNSSLFLDPSIINEIARLSDLCNKSLDMQRIKFSRQISHDIADNENLKQTQENAHVKNIQQAVDPSTIALPQFW